MPRGDWYPQGGIRCSRSGKTSLFSLLCFESALMPRRAGCNLPTVSPPEESGNDLQHLKFLGIRSLESKKVNKMIGDELPDDDQLVSITVWTRQRACLPYLSIFSSGLPFFRYRRAFVRWSFKITASCRSLPISKFFSLTSFSNGRARSRSLDTASSDV